MVAAFAFPNHVASCVYEENVGLSKAKAVPARPGNGISHAVAAPMRASPT